MKSFHFKNTNINLKMLLRKQTISKNVNYIRKQPFMYRKFSHKDINYFNKTNLNFNEKRILLTEKLSRKSTIFNRKLVIHFNENSDFCDNGNQLC